jgi:ABC-type multidrug transport system fused ATPase/permease subunit
MNLTLGFIAFFISIVIPGILFRRFFFYGEFSKQFNTKDPVLHSIFFSIIPGIVIQVISFIIYNLSLGFDSSYLDVFTIFRDITSDGANGIQEPTKNFLNNNIITFFIYSTIVFIFASFSGWFSSRFIRVLNWDKKYKLFRYNNQWYYIFSGEVLNMKKFEDAHNVSFKNNKGQVQDTLMTYADILVSVSDQNDRKELYTGYVVDYDLQSDDITQLDKVYLIDTHRYKKKEKNTDKDGLAVIDENPTQSRNRLKVPGDIFVLNAKKIVNLNLTYIPSLKKEIEKEKKEAEKQKLYSKIQKGYLISILAIIFIHFFYKVLTLDKSFLSDYFINIGFWGKLLIIFFINQFIVIFVPFKGEDKKLCYNFNNIKIKILSLIFWGILSYFLVIKDLL